MNKNYRKLEVSPELLVEVLNLPEGTVLDFAQLEINGNIIFRISHPEFCAKCAKALKKNVSVVLSNDL